MNRSCTIASIILLSVLLFTSCAKETEESNAQIEVSTTKSMDDLDIKIVSKADIQAIAITLSTSFKEGKSKTQISNC